MLFSRRNAALVAAFLAPSAYAQTSNPNTNPTTGPAQCATAGNAVFNLGATQGTGTVGELALQVTAGTTGCTVGGVTGQLISTVTGNFGANQITYVSATSANSDNCLVPCPATGSTVLSTLGFSFTTGSTTNNNLVTYQVRANAGALQVYTVTGANVGTTAQANPVAAGNACNAPSAGAAVCDATLTCDSNNNRFYAFTGTDGNGGTIRANIAFTNTLCGASNGVTGYTVSSLTGTYQGTNQVTPERLALVTSTQGNCFYPCAAAIVDTQGISFSVTPGNTGTAGATLRFNSGGANGALRITPASGASTAVTQQTLVESCPNTSNAFFACPVTSSSSSASSVASSSSAIVSIPSVSVSVPFTQISSSVAPSSSVVIISNVPISNGGSSAVIVTVPATSSSAPASLITTRASSGAASSTIAIATSATGPQTSVPTPFLISVNVGVSLKRQAVQYVGNGGALTSDPTQAAVFQLINGQLFSDGQIVSTGPQIPAQQPLDGGAQGTITTVWTSNNGAIAWTNAVFANGAATFCVVNNIVNTVFVAAPANGCVPVALTGVAVSAAVPATASGAAGGITINNFNNPTIGVMVTVNLVLGTSTLGNGSVITTTGLSSSTSPLYAAASNGAYCLPCHMSAVGASCPNAGNVVYTTACAACAAYTAAPAAVVTCPTCAPLALPTATGAAAPAAAPAGAAGAAGAAPATTFTGSAITFGISAAAVMVAGAALLL